MARPCRAGQPHPLPGGVPLRFASADRDRTIAGWLTLRPAVE
jgi:hypothetical protein